MITYIYIILIIIIIISVILGFSTERKSTRYMLIGLSLVFIYGIFYVHKTQLLPRGYSNSYSIAKLASKNTLLGEDYVAT